MHLDELQYQFSQRFPDVELCGVCRVPGRVNLIGEHLDYNGLPVLPVATEEGISCAFGRLPGAAVELRNADAQYAACRFENAYELARAGAGDWSNYSRAAVAGLNKLLKPAELPGMALYFEGDLPVASGLSSSSALVVAAAMAYLRILGCTLDVDISRTKLAQVLAEAEHFVGTRGGGMDQAAILNARAGHGCKIDFFPLRLEQVRIPDGTALFVCDSGVRAEKSGAALARYNAGPALCRVICALIERQLREEIDEDFVLPRIGDLIHGPLCLRQHEAEELARRSLSKPCMSSGEIAVRLSTTEAELRKRFLGDLPEPSGGFPLAARLRHVLSEFRRVEQFRDALLEGAVDEAGQLMFASHRSCAEDYAISIPALDELVAEASEGGALGARLTGAGFGGATVNWVRDDVTAAFEARLRAWCEAHELQPDTALRRIRPGDGAAYLV